MDNVFTLIRDSKRPEKMIHNLEQAFQLFIADNLDQVNVIQKTDEKKKSGQGIPAFESETAPLSRRRSHLYHLTSLFGIGAVTCMFYSMISTRTYNGLMSARHLQTKESSAEEKKRHYILLNELVSMIPDDFKGIRQFGKKGIAEIELVLGQYGLRLGMPDTEIEKCFGTLNDER